MRVALFSPINPMKSGISDFVEELSEVLKHLCELTLFVPDEIDCSSSSYDDLVVKNISDYDNQEVRNNYDVAVYHVGNNYTLHHQIVESFLNYGGILELHDIALHHYYAEGLLCEGKSQEYVELMTYCHGKMGWNRAQDFLKGSKPAWEQESLKYCLNKYLVDQAEAVIVHSQFAYEMIKGTNVDVPVYIIPLHSIEVEQGDEQNDRMHCRKQLGISEDEFAVGMFGFCTKEKRPSSILEAISKISPDVNIHLYIVGECADQSIHKMIEKNELQNRVSVLGRVELDVFQAYMSACDCALNLRFPTQGESSASLTRLLGLGKPCLVTDIGSFADFPDNVVIKIKADDNEVDSIKRGLEYVLSNEETMKNTIIEYAREYLSVTRNAEKYIGIFKNVIGRATAKEDFEDDLISKIQKMGCLNTDYYNHIAERIIF